MNQRFRPKNHFTSHNGSHHDPASPAIYSRTETPRVLVLESDRFMADLLEEWLASAGYATVLAARGSSLCAANSGVVDAVLVDVSSPRHAAAASVARLRSAFPGTPVIVMSGHFLAREGHAADEVARELGAVGLLAKPFTRESLLSTLKHRLKRE
jgi:CheY-like chemotaxis protein